MSDEVTTLISKEMIIELSWKTHYKGVINEKEIYECSHLVRSVYITFTGHWGI